MTPSKSEFLTILAGRAEIAEAQQRFMASMIRGAKPLGVLPIGWHGGYAEREVYWHPKLDVWMCFDSVATENRHWNAFGVGDPRDSRGSLAIVVEINSPFSGINRRIAGAFARDPDSELYLLHRGKVGGGRKGIGKKSS